MQTNHKTECQTPVLFAATLTPEEQNLISLYRYCQGQNLSLLIQAGNDAPGIVLRANDGDLFTIHAGGVIPWTHNKAISATK